MTSNFSLGKVEVSLTPTERFEEFLKSRGKRVTQQRRMIVEDVFAQHDHFNADELCDVLQKAGRDVSRPTVYRTLNEMVEAGLLRKMTIGSRSVYELDYGYPQHDHLYCEKCDKLMEFQSEEIVRIREQVAREFSFRVSGHRFIVYGICDECQKRTRRRPRRLEMV